MDGGRKNSEGLDPFKRIASEVTDGFVQLMDKTRSQLEEMDPLEASVRQREVFQKNLKSSKSPTVRVAPDTDSDDSDSGVGVSSSGTGCPKSE